MSPSLPVMMLTILGSVIAVIGIFAAGDMLVAGVGLGALIAAAFFGSYEARLQSSRPDTVEPVRGRE